MRGCSIVSNTLRPSGNREARHGLGRELVSASLPTTLVRQSRTNLSPESSPSPETSSEAAGQQSLTVARAQPVTKAELALRSSESALLPEWTTVACLLFEMRFAARRLDEAVNSAGPKRGELRAFLEYRGYGGAGQPSVGPCSEHRADVSRENPGRLFREQDPYFGAEMQRVTEQKQCAAAEDTGCIALGHFDAVDGLTG